MLLMLFLSLLTLLHWFAGSGQGIRSMMDQVRHGVSHLRQAFISLALCLHLRG